MASKMIIDTDELSEKLVNALKIGEGEKYEKELFDVLEVYEKLGDFVGIIKEKLRDKFLEEDENFAGLKGKYLKFEVRKFGSVYGFDKGVDVDSAFVVERVSKSVNAKAVEKYLEENKELPSGIVENERSNVMVIKKL